MHTFSVLYTYVATWCGNDHLFISHRYDHEANVNKMRIVSKIKTLVKKKKCLEFVTNLWLNLKHRFLLVPLVEELCYDTLGGLWKNAWITLRRHHDRCDGVSNHLPHDCLLNRLFGRRSKWTSKLRVTGLCVRISPVTRLIDYIYICIRDGITLPRPNFDSRLTTLPLKVEYLIMCIICDTDLVNKLILQVYTLHKYK